MKLSCSFASFFSLVIIACLLTNGSVEAQDIVADNMLAYQRAIGGWPKHINEVKIDYSKPLFDEQKYDIIADSLHSDATVDNGATIKEIRYLANAYKTSGNRTYLRAAEKGLNYLLKAQNKVGGWPQFYPDSSLYRAQITYNDNAMVNVLNVLMDVKLGINNMDVVDASFKPRAAAAIDKGVECILKTQVKVNGKLTVWCAQHDRKTLQPTGARKYELPSLSGSESVGITAFLMKLPHPSDSVKRAIASAVEWLQSVKITGYRYGNVKDDSQPKGHDRVLVAEPSSVVWARFYEVGTNKPFFCGRDGIKKYDVKEIEHERRTGYGWYGTWAKELLENEYPKWLKSNS